MLKRIGLLILACATLAACEAPMPMSHIAANGQSCHSAGLPWAQYYVTPDNSAVCHAR
jgi:hypothetical protein